VITETLLTSAQLLGLTPAAIYAISPLPTTLIAPASVGDPRRLARELPPGSLAFVYTASQSGAVGLALTLYRLNLAACAAGAPLAQTIADSVTLPIPAAGIGGATGLLQLPVGGFVAASLTATTWSGAPSPLFLTFYSP